MSVRPNRLKLFFMRCGHRDIGSCLPILPAELPKSIKNDRFDRVYLSILHFVIICFIFFKKSVDKRLIT